MTEPIRIFVGVSANNEDLEFQSVLHYSLEKQASRPIDLNWMRISRDPSSFWYADPQHGRGWRMDGWATPFSALRWGIPAACGFEGKAIYMDVDMIARADIAELWDTPFDGKPMVSKPNAICVSMYDNAAMKQVLPPIEDVKQPQRYRELRRMMSSPNVIRRYEHNWNCLDMRRDDGFGEYKNIDDPDIKILHFTAIPTQPHLRHAIPRLQQEGKAHWYTTRKFARDQVRVHHRKDALNLFDDLLAEATANGYGLDRYRTTPFGDYGP